MRPSPGAYQDLERLTFAGDGRIQDPESKSRLAAQLTLLIAKEQELAEAQVSYYRNYRAAAVLKKLLQGMACGDDRQGIESYNALRETLEISLNSHPYVRVLIGSAFREGQEY